MRHGSILGVGLGLVVVLPSLTASQSAGELERTLSDTVRALAVLTGLEPGLAARPPEQTVELARSATEPAFGDEAQRDEQLQRLRKDVGRLQMLSDELARVAEHDPAQVPSPSSPSSTGGIGHAGLAITTGLDDRLRAQLSSEPLLTLPRDPQAAGTEHRTAKAAHADVLRQGQALLRAGKAKEALAVLRDAEDDVRANYWMARALEQLDRADEALDLYRAVAAAPTAGYLAQRAKNDAEFVEWKRGFAARLGVKSAQEASSKAPAAVAPAATTKEGGR